MNAMMSGGYAGNMDKFCGNATVNAQKAVRSIFRSTY